MLSRTKSMLLAAAFAGFSLPVSATCLSQVPNACPNGVYSPQNVGSYYLNLYSQQYQAYASHVDPDSGETVSQCLERCKAEYEQWAALCNNFSDAGVPSSRWLCRIEGEDILRTCMRSCRPR